MKIGILTLSASDNCGSLLQTYALQKVLENYGHDVWIINFVTKVSEKMYRIFHPSYIRDPIKLFGTFFRYKHLKRQKYDYKKFRNISLNMTKQKYRNIDDLKQVDGEYDIVICGSDQVWNINMYDFDDAYLLSWCDVSKCFSYAASLGDNKKGTLKDMLKHGFVKEKFEAISVRESSAKEKFDRELGITVDLCLDPTLLMTKQQWQILTDRNIVPKGDFIFYYSYNYADSIKNRIVQEFAKKMKLPVYVINISKWLDGKDKEYGFIILEYSGPIAFLSLMYYCKYSLVESFHGTVFSYIFKKQFWFLENSSIFELDDRINDIMEILEVKERILNPDKININMYKDIDYSKMPCRLCRLQKSSFEYIRSIVS